MLPEFSDWLTLPPIPTFRDQVHPLIVHFPIALLLVAPLFVFLAMVLFRKGRWFSVSALMLLALGTAGAFVAVETGEAAGEVAMEAADQAAKGEGLSDAAQNALEEHQDLARAVPLIFAILTGVYLAILIVPLVIRPLGHPAVVFLLNLVFLAALLAADLLVVHAGYRGTWVVHEYGIHTQMEAPPKKAKEPEQEAKEKAKPAAAASKKK